MGILGTYGTLKTEYLQEFAKNRKNHIKFQFQSRSATIYFDQFGWNLVCRYLWMSSKSMHKKNSWLKPNIDFWTPSWAPRRKKTKI